MATENDDDPDQLDPLDRMLEFTPGPIPAVAPDGGFAPQIVGPPEPIPEATPETMLCFRDCRHYLQIDVPFGAGNTKGTLSRPAVQLTRYCTRTPSPIDLTDEVVYNCTAWDPVEADVLASLLKRRADWYAAHPDIGPPVDLTATPLVKDGN